MIHYTACLYRMMTHEYNASSPLAILHRISGYTQLMGRFTIIQFLTFNYIGSYGPGNKYSDLGVVSAIMWLLIEHICTFLHPSSNNLHQIWYMTYLDYHDKSCNWIVHIKNHNFPWQDIGISQKSNQNIFYLKNKCKSRWSYFEGE